MTNVIQIGRYEYIHVLDENKVVTRLVVGPQTFIKKAHEKVVRGKTPMVEVHPMHYCKIQNPVALDKSGRAVTMFDDGQVKVRHGEQEIRFHQDKPFPLYPGERLIGSVQKMAFIAKDTAYLVQALRDFKDTMADQDRKAGDQWQVKGPKTYSERVEVKVVGSVKGKVIREGQALMIQAQRELTDINSVKRRAGERWLIRKEGMYLPRLYEQVVEICKGVVLTHKTALQVRAKASFKDVYGKNRKAGEEWLVTVNDGEIHIIDVYEESVKTVYNTSLSNRQYCVVLDPYDEDKKCNSYGTKLLRKGPLTFFLQPGESLQNGVQKVRILGEQQALLLKAKQDCEDQEGNHKAGEKWMVKGPCEYIPQTEVEILRQDKSFALNKNEGIYIRNLETGEVNAVIGHTYMLKANEVLWEKELPAIIERQIQQQQVGRKKGKRDKWRVVQYQVPQKSAIQLYDYKSGVKEVIFGPGLILLRPHQEFTPIKLSGGTPKKEGVVETLFMQLGPGFMTDIVEVETADHAKLSLLLCYNWHFKCERDNEQEVNKLFQIEDFVGNCCQTIASRVRGSVSSVAFEEFQSDSENIIKKAVFGVNKETGIVRGFVHFKSNNLFVTSVDVKSAQPIDVEVQRNLEKSISVSMDMTTQQNESKARYKAAVQEQLSLGKLHCAKLEDMNQSEKAKQNLLVAQAKTLKIQLAGKAKAGAEAEARKQEILGKAQVEQAKLEAQAEKIKAEQELEMMKKQHTAELETMKLKNEYMVTKAEKLSQIEIAKFQQIIEAIGKETLVSISKSGPAMKAKMLKGLGLKGFLVTDGKNPINLFNTANGMLGQMGQ